MISGLRIGIWISEAGSWFGGISYIENLVKAIATLPQQPKLALVCTTKTRPYLERFQSITALIDHSICLTQTPDWDTEIEPGFNGTPCQTYAQLFEQIDFLYPCLQAIDAAATYPHACWIPDFQHVDLPQLFSPEEIHERNALFSEIAVRSPLLVLSSQHTAQKFQTLYPASQTIRRILSFHTLPDPHWFASDPLETVEKYQLPDRFLICNNQFWQHKGHAVLLDAIADLRHLGQAVALICTGDTSDYRNVDYFQQLEQQIRDLGISDLVYILGAIPRADQMQLMRQSLAIVQPSNYEGWSTIVEEAQALGKPIVLSDFPVHLEQNPDRAVYFPQGDSQALAAALAETLPTLTAGVNLETEAIARQQSAEKATHFAQQFCQIALEAQFIFSKKPQGMNSQLWNILSTPLTPHSSSGEMPDHRSDASLAELPMEPFSPSDAADSDDVEVLRSQLRQAQQELTQAQAELRQVFSLRRNVNQAVEQAKIFKATAEERLSSIEHLNQIAEERSRLIGDLNQVAEERLQLIDHLSQVAEERLALNELLERKAEDSERNATRFEKKAERLQQRVEELKRSLNDSKQQIGELEQKVAYLSSLQGISRTLRKKLFRKV
jgi:glycosyltransferase involved in cell wall biosynthesis